MECPYCGAVYNETVCPYCGASAPKQEKEDENIKIHFQNKTLEFDLPKVEIPNSVKKVNKSRIAALILCLIGFFGFGGLHRLYAKKYVSGILYLLTGGCFYIGTVIDLALIVTGNFKYKDGTPL